MNPTPARLWLTLTVLHSWLIFLNLRIQAEMNVYVESAYNGSVWSEHIRYKRRAVHVTTFLIVFYD